MIFLIIVGNKGYYLVFIPFYFHFCFLLRELGLNPD